MIENDSWKDADGSLFWNVGSSLKGKTVGIFGHGRIGQNLAQKLKVFSPKQILYTSRSSKGDLKDLQAVEFNELLAKSDVLIITAALNEITKGIFDRKAFEKMQKTAIIINVSRGGLINQEDLIQSLKVNSLNFRAKTWTRIRI